MNKVIKSIVSLCLAFALCIGVTSVAQTTPNGYIVADAATTTADSYYDGITATSGNALLGQLHDLITTTHTSYSTYDDCHYKATDTDPGSKSDTVMEFYTHTDINFSSWDVSGGWNREHVWPKGNSNGLWKDVSKTTKNAGSDLHHIRPAEKDLNNDRGNMKYGEVSGGTERYTSGSHVLGGHSTGSSTTGTFEPLDNVKGDVARIVMYVYTHYNTYSNVNGTINGGAQSGVFGTLKLTDIIKANDETAAQQLLLNWNKLDPVDSIETTRNDVVYGIQGNRNPFIDNPSYADAIWGDGTVVVDPNPPTPDVTPTGLSLNAAALTLNVGNTYNLTVTATPSGASNSVSWSSSNTTVVSVANGKVTANKAGTATVTATSTVDSTVKATVTVTVEESSTPTPSDTFGAGTYKISIDLTAASGVGKVLYFNGNIANDYYLGTTDNESSAAEVEVAAVNGGYTLKTGGKYIEVVKSGDHFNAVLNSSSSGVWKYNSDLKTVTWRIDSNGNDYYLGTRTNDSGYTYTTISASETKYITGDYADKVGVTQFIIEFEKEGAPESITVNPSSVTLEEGKTASLSAVTVPANAAADIVWTSSDTTVATVSANGTVTAVKKGVVEIKASSKDNPAIYGSSTVTVIAKDEPVTPPAKTIEIVPDTITVKVGQSSSVKVVDNLGADVDRAEYDLEISDETVAVIDGVSISGKKVGVCTLTATLKSDPTVKATAEIYVVNEADVLVHITSSGDKYMQIGEVGRLEVTFTPSDKSVEVIWSSTDESVVKVDQNGNITAVGAGTAAITATSKVNPNIVSNSQTIVVKSESENVKKFIESVAKMAEISDDTTMRDMYSLIVDAVKIYNTLNADEKADVAIAKIGLEVIINMYNISVKAANSAAGSAEANALGGVGGYVKGGE